LGAVALLDRLDQALEAGGARDLPERQQTMRATLRWSYELLSEEERVLFRRLGVFAGGFTLESLESLRARLGEGEALDELAGLVDNSLAVPLHGGGDMRFRLLQTVRDYALEQLAEAGEEADVRRRHAEHYLEVALGATAGLDGPAAPDLLARLETEQLNLAAALDFAAEHGEGGLLAGLAAALRPYWVAQGRLTEGRRWLRAAREFPDLPDTVRGRVCAAGGILAYQQDAPEEATALLSEARELSAAAGDLEGVALASCYLGALQLGEGEPTQARELAETALEAAVAGGFYEPHVLAVSLYAVIAAATGDPEAERSHYLQRLELVRRHGDRVRTADTLNSLAEIALTTGDSVCARSFAEEALQLARRLAVPATRDALLTLARAALADGDPERAVAAGSEAVRLSVELGQDFELSRSLDVLAAAAAASARWDRAARLLGAARQLRDANDALGVRLEPDLDPYREQVAERLGAAFATAVASGAALTKTEAASYALQDDEIDQEIL